MKGLVGILYDCFALEWTRIGVRRLGGTGGTGGGGTGGTGGSGGGRIVIECSTFLLFCDGCSSEQRSREPGRNLGIRHIQRNQRFSERSKISCESWRCT